MSKDWVKDVLDFHEECRLAVRTTIGRPTIETHNMHWKETKETFGKLLFSRPLRDSDLAELADGIIDLIYELICLGAAYGLPLNKVWDAIHKSNLEKRGGPRGELGKLLPPTNWRHPNIGEILREEMRVGPPPKEGWVICKQLDAERLSIIVAGNSIDGEFDKWIYAPEDEYPILILNSFEKGSEFIEKMNENKSSINDSRLVLMKCEYMPREPYLKYHNGMVEAKQLRIFKDKAYTR